MSSSKGDSGRFGMNLKWSGLTGYATRRSILGSKQAVVGIPAFALKKLRVVHLVRKAGSVNFSVGSWQMGAAEFPIFD